MSLFYFLRKYFKFVTFQVKNYALEKHSVDFAQVMQLAKSNADKTKESITKPKVTKKVVITVRKKKKRAPEGGC